MQLLRDVEGLVVQKPDGHRLVGRARSERVTLTRGTRISRPSLLDDLGGAIAEFKVLDGDQRGHVVQVRKSSLMTGTIVEGPAVIGSARR
jgi:hypothetical protein